MTGPRVLYVNWVDYLDADRRGGGVTLYQRNLMEARRDGGAVFLASGTSYDLRAGPPRWEAMRHGPDTDRDRRFEIVNSGVLAPSHFSFGDPAQLHHGPTCDVFFDFLEAQGPFDVVHFNNLEGLPAEVLTLTSRFPQTRVVLSLHNYYPFCPQVNLWWQERAHCDDYQDGRACGTCLDHRPSAGAMRVAAGLAYRLKSAGLEPGSRGYDWTYRVAMGLARRVVMARRGRRTAASAPDLARAARLAPEFVRRRARMVELINTRCDAVLCVSEAVRRIAVGHGIDPDLAETCYIGTAQAAAWDHTSPRDVPAVSSGPSPLRLAYLGYMRRDKGFFFMLDALEQAPPDLTARLHLVVAARRVSAQVLARLEALRPALAGLDWHDGYRHDQLDDLLAGVDVGLVPVMWEDCLPQVAIELHSRHIPLLCSDRGGARELSRCPQMVFPAGDVAAFHDRLHALVTGRIDMGAYWRMARAPVSMPDHLAALEAIYERPSRAATKGT